MRNNITEINVARRTVGRKPLTQDQLDALAEYNSTEQDVREVFAQLITGGIHAPRF